jgi:Adenylate and Guanylate cyclase catalytic domain
VVETRKLVAILVADVVGYSRLAGSDEDRTLARLRAVRSDLIDPTIAVHHGRVVKRTGDGAIVEFRSVVDAVRCAIEVLNGMLERNTGLLPDRRIEFRVGIHVGDVVEELLYLARTYVRTSIKFDDAWRHVAEAATAVETTKEKWFEAELHRASPAKLRFNHESER